MSHIPQRKEKDCLNCGTIVQGKYCHNCGQENVEPKETFWHMVTHFFYDITHFDSNFFTTVKDLLFRPGFLSKEYMKGKRVSYLHPVRMYVFTSAIFFLLFFSFFATGDEVKMNITGPIKPEEKREYIKDLEQKLADKPGNEILIRSIALLKDTSKEVTVQDILSVNPDFLAINFINSSYRNRKEYDSLQQLFPSSKRDGWLMRRIVYKQIDINKKYQGNPNELLKDLSESVLHRLPYMLLISLPFFALLLKFLYVRRKQFYYADHGVFAIHLYVFTFLLLLSVFSLRALQNATGWDFITFLVIILVLILFFYLYKAMRNFYGQGRWKTFFKFLFVSFWSLIMMLILFALFMFFSAATL